MNYMERNTETLSNTMAEEAPNLEPPAADFLQNVGDSGPACLMNTQTQNTDCRDDAVSDYGVGEATAPVSDTAAVTTSCQSSPIVENENENEKALYNSVLRQMQQQQKLRPGRRYKKKTLMKMAKLFVIAKDWDSKIAEASEVKYSNGSLSEHEPSVLNQRMEMLTSSSASQKKTVKTKSAHVRRSDCDEETFLPATSADTIFSGQPSAPQVTLMSSTRTNHAEEESSASAHLHDIPDLNQDVSADSKLITTPNHQSKSKKISSATFQEDTKITCDSSEIAGISPAVTSSVDVFKTESSKHGPIVNVKKRSNQKPLPQTLTDHNAVMQQDLSEDFLVSDATQKDKNEAMCVTAAEIHIKDPPGTKPKKKRGRPPKKKWVMSKTKPFIQEAEITGDSKKSDASNADVLSYEQPSLSQVSSRGKNSNLKSVKTVDVTPESIIKTEEVTAGYSPNDEVSLHVEHQDGGVQNMEVKTGNSEKDIMLQKQNQTTKETTVFSTSQLRNPQRCATNNRKCKLEPMNVPVSATFSDHSAMNQCAASDSLMQTADIKTEPACEPLIQQSTSEKSRQQKRPLRRAKNTLTSNAPIKEESDYFDIQLGTFSKEEQLNKETTNGNNPKKSRKGKRKQKKVKVSDQTVNADLNIKGEVYTLNQLYLPPMHLEKESDESYISLPKSQPCRKRKFPRKCKDNPQLMFVCGSEENLPCGDDTDNKTKEDVENSKSSITSKTLDIAHESLKQTGKRKSVKPEPEDTFLENVERNERKCKKLKQRKVKPTSLDDLMEVNTQPENSLSSHLKQVTVQNNILDKDVNIQDDLTNPPNEKSRDVNIGNQEETLNVPKDEQERKCPRVAALVEEEDVTITGEVQSAENELTSPSVPENVTEMIKAKRQRESKEEEQNLKLDHSGEGFNIVSNHDDTSLVKRSKRVKRELCTFEDDKIVQLQDNVASFGGQTKESLENINTETSEKTACAKTSPQGKQRVSHKRKKSSSAALLSEDTSQVEDLKNDLTISFEAPKSDLTQRETIKSKVETKSKFGKKAKKRLLMDLPNQDHGEKQPESETGVLVNHGICSKPKNKGRSSKGKAPAKSGQALKAVKMEDAVSSIDDSADMDVKQEHDESKISEAVSTFQDKISLLESVVSAENTNMTPTKKRRRNKTVWYPKMKLKRHQSCASFNSSSPVSVHPCNSVTDDELTNVKLKDVNDDVIQRNTSKPPRSDEAEEVTADTDVEHSFELKNCDLLPQKLKPQKPLKCSFCSRSFRHISALTVHKRIHTGEKPYRCITCGKRFAHISRLNQHSKLHNESPAVCCPCCDQKFKSKDELIVHFLTHVKDIKSSNVTEDTHSQQEGHRLDSPVTSSYNKPFRCSVCCKEFISRATFKMHRRTHDGKLYTCSVCGKKFHKPSSLSVHEKTHSEMHSRVTAFSCTICEKAFESYALLRSHQVFEVCSEKEDSTEGNRIDFEGILVSQGVEGQIVTPVCKASEEERACRSSLSEEPEVRSQESEAPDEDEKGQTSFSPQVETGEKEVTDMQPSPPSPSDSSPSVNDDFDVSIPSPQPAGELGNDKNNQQPNKFHTVRRYCGRYSCRRCGKCFKSWNTLWLHQRSHHQTVRPFRCSQCDLEFRFLGSYIDHLQEHTTQMPYTCPLCPGTFSSGEKLNAHISECHKQDSSIKCSTCGKSFSTLRHLKKHKLLHKGASSHFCLPCNVSFSHISALKTHLKTHRTRLKVPQPAGFAEPLLFPYHCRKCTSKFSSTDLLKAHQVFHFTAEENPTENITSCVPSRAPEDTQLGAVSVSSQRKRLPASNKKHLYRYPHPDRLYVVPVVSSEPPVVISDIEEEQQKAHSPSITSPPSDTTSSTFPNGEAAPDISNIPQPSAVPIVRNMAEHLPGSSLLQPQDYSLIPPILRDLHHYQDAWKYFSDTSDCDSDSAELVGESVDDTHNCTICTETFTDMSKLHEHYINHTKGMQK